MRTNLGVARTVHTEPTNESRTRRHEQRRKYSKMDQKGKG